MSVSLSHIVSPSMALSDMYVKVNDEELCSIDITEYESVYGGCNVPAKLVFIDSYGHTTGDVQNVGNLQVGGVVEIGFTTAQRCDFKETYVIKSIQTQTNKKNQKLVTLELEDLDTRILKGAFISKGYQQEPFSKVVEKHYKEICKKDLKEMVISPIKDEAKMNITIPAHLSFYDYLNLEMVDRGYKYVKDRMYNYLVHSENKEFNALMDTGLVFEYNVTNQYSTDRILQFNIDGVNSDDVLENVDTSNTSINQQDMSKPNAIKDGIDTKISKKKASESKNDVAFSGIKASDLVMSKGSKQGSVIGKNKQYFEALSNAQKCTIWVPGRTDNLVGKRVKVIFPKPTYYSKTQSDHIFSGTWEVQFVRDKVIGGYFVNELHLRRPGGIDG